jgi:hypothetical protein
VRAAPDEARGRSGLRNRQALAMVAIVDLTECLVIDHDRARYYLGDVTFETVIDRVNRQPTLASVDAAKLELERRRRMCVALFHDGTRLRA